MKFGGGPLGCRGLGDGAVGEGRGGKVVFAGVVAQMFPGGGGVVCLVRVTVAKDGLLG